MAGRKKQSTSKKTNKRAANDFIAALEPYFASKAPLQIPAAGRKVVVQWLPWISLVLGIFCVLAFLPLVGLGVFVSALSVAYNYSSGGMIWLPIFMLLVQGIVLIVAFPGLMRRSLSAWKLLFWADIIFFGYNVINAFMYPMALVGNLISAVITVALGLYILFQVKSSYK